MASGIVAQISGTTLWRWLLHRSDSPWYPSARLFRQRAIADWDDVVRRLKNPLIYQTGPNTSAKSGCSCSIWEKRCISGPSQASRMVGSRS